MATTTVKDIFVGDVGTHFVCQLINLVSGVAEAPLDISSAEEMVVVFLGPDGVEKEFTGGFPSPSGPVETTGDGVDGLMEYITQENDPKDLHIDGKWEYYGWVQYPGGQRRSSSVKFTVYPGRQSEEPEE